MDSWHADHPQILTVRHFQFLDSLRSFFVPTDYVQVKVENVPIAQLKLGRIQSNDRTVLPRSILRLNLHRKDDDSENLMRNVCDLVKGQHILEVNFFNFDPIYLEARPLHILFQPYLFDAIFVCRSWSYQIWHHADEAGCETRFGQKIHLKFFHHDQLVVNRGQI